MEVMEAELRGVGEHDSNWVNYSEMNKYTYTTMLTALGVGSSLLTQPFNVVTTRQQAGRSVTGDPVHSSVYSAMKGYVNTLGWRGMFRGWAPVGLMGVPSQLIYLTITESTRESFQKSLRSILPDASSATIDGLQASGTSIIANAVSYVPYVPAEVISSRMMIQGRKGSNMRQIVKIIWKEDGFKGFYRGFNASLLYGILLSAQWWWSYSVCRREFTRIDFLKSNPLLLDASTGLVAGRTPLTLTLTLTLNLTLTTTIIDYINIVILIIK
jgi:hypothetical protein